ncbi:SDR family oxidoreductase, partial [Streptomyces sp. NPDC056653]|uniref:SDR family oxidoreductase n=1 Tax=Streptomyces sp. NPDC056653 TaxID=3345894 RepID=UPI0036972C01
MAEMDEPRVALVTGAGQGIGRAIALRLAQDGFDVAVNDIERGKDNAAAVVAEIEALGRRGFAAIGDITDPASVANLVSETVGALGRLDVAVANAGIARIESLLDSTAESWDQTFAINTKGVFLTWQAAARQFISQGGGGKLIAAASQVAHRAAGDLPAYSASKFAVRGLTQAAAQELAKHGITANAYAPGIVNTKLWENDRDTFDALVGMIPLGRAQEPDDVASLVSFFASRASDYMTGQTVIMDGGMIFS